MEDSVFLLIIAVISIAVWLIMRPIMLWYFKINEIEELLLEQVKILRIVHSEKLKEKEEEREKEFSTIKGVKYNIPAELSYREMDNIKEKSAHLKPGQLLSIDIKTGATEFWDIEEFNELKESNPKTTLIMVAIKE